MNERDIENLAHEMANRLPATGPEAARPRERFDVERVWSEGTRYIGLRVRVDDGDFLASYTTPGQYLTFQYGGLEPHYLVIASAPDLGEADEGRWEFLIDRDSDLGAELDDIEAGHRVLLSPAEGSGYPADAVDGDSVLIFTTGAGIASVRPVMQHWRNHPERAPGELAVYYGESEPHEFAYVAELADWRARGARIFEAIENLPEPQEGYRYVQHAFEADAPELDHAAIFVSGAPIMMELVIDKLLRLGVPPEHIHINV